MGARKKIPLFDLDLMTLIIPLVVVLAVLMIPPGPGTPLPSSGSLQDRGRRL
jgi:hypothetical protein